MWRLKKAIATMEFENWTKMKLEELYKVSSECKLNSWPDNLFRLRVWMEFGGRGFKSQSGQLSLTTSQNPSVVNTINTISFCYTHVITCARYQLKQMWQLPKAIAEIKSKHWAKDEIGIALQCQLWVQIELLTW